MMRLRLLAAAAVLVAALAAACGGVDQQEQPVEGLLPPPSSEVDAVEASPPSPPRSVPSIVDRVRVLSSLDDLIAASTVVVQGTAVTGMVKDSTCRLEPEYNLRECFFVEFQVDSVLAGEFIDGSSQPQTVDIRHWGLNLDGADMEQDGRYVLFLYPFELLRGELVGDYQIVDLFAGMFSVDDPAKLESLDPITRGFRRSPLSRR